jgi:putative glutamine amidotransferase
VQPTIKVAVPSDAVDLTSSTSPITTPPLIGLSVYVEMARHGAWEEYSALLPMTYVTSVIRSGAAPLLLPPAPSGPAAVLPVLDGLIITGGPDVDPRLYGAEPHAETETPRTERDGWESALCLAALAENLPVLAICRGVQILNVALGGTLHQHLPDVTGNDHHREVVGQMSATLITLDPNSAFGSILGGQTEGLCHHHQAIDRLGRGVLAAGYAADGTVEAVEVAGPEFALGVQWHPEDNPDDDRLFAALVDAASRHRAGRSQ